MLRVLLLLGLAAAVAADPLADSARRLAALEEKLARRPTDASLAEQLVAACLERARLTGDPAYYRRAHGALPPIARVDAGRAHALRGSRG